MIAYSVIRVAKVWTPDTFSPRFSSGFVSIDPQLRKYAAQQSERSSVPGHDT
jgi:hypothetical protein